MQLLSGATRNFLPALAKITNSSPRLLALGKQQQQPRLRWLQSEHSVSTSSSRFFYLEKIKDIYKRNNSIINKSAWLLFCCGVPVSVLAITGFRIVETPETGRKRIMMSGWSLINEGVPKPLKYVVIKENDAKYFNFEMSDDLYKQMEVKEKSKQICDVMQRLREANPDKVPSNWEVYFTVDATFTNLNVLGSPKLDWSVLDDVSSDDELACLLGRVCASRHLSHKREYTGVACVCAVFVYFAHAFEYLRLPGVLMVTFFGWIFILPFSIGQILEKEADDEGSQMAKKADFNVDKEMREKFKSEGGESLMRFGWSRLINFFYGF